MRKEIVLFVMIIIILNIFLIIQAQEIPLVGNINPETGTPSSFEKLQQTGEQLQQLEQNKSFLSKDWTIMNYDTPIVGPLLYYTEEFFSFFNPVWNIAFGIEFSWSWEFILCLVIWVILIIVIYSPAKALTDFNIILTFIFSAIVATLVGISGIIKKSVEDLMFGITNLWILLVVMVIIVLLIALYSMFFKNAGENLKKKSEEEDLERAKQDIKLHGKISNEALKKMRKLP